MPSKNNPTGIRSGTGGARDPSKNHLTNQALAHINPGNRVRKIGDTMTGQLVIEVEDTLNPTTQTNNEGISSTGHGTGGGGTFTGGSSGGVGITATATGVNPGVDSTGSGTGPGVSGTGGTTTPTALTESVGILGVGGSSGGVGGHFTAVSNNDAGIIAQGHGSGSGVKATGGVTSDGIGLEGYGGGPDGAGVYGVGAGVGLGVGGMGGPSGGPGVYGFAQAGNASGVVGEGDGSGSGVSGQGGATGVGVSGIAGATGGSGVVGTSSVAHGVVGSGGGSGSGGSFSGGSTAGTGVSATAGAGGTGVSGLGDGAGVGGDFQGGATGPGVQGAGARGGVFSSSTPAVYAPLRLVPSGGAAPTSPLKGDIWVADSGRYEGLPQIYNGTTWTPLGKSLKRHDIPVTLAASSTPAGSLLIDPEYRFDVTERRYYAQMTASSDSQSYLYYYSWILPYGFTAWSTGDACTVDFQADDSACLWNVQVFQNTAVANYTKGEVAVGATTVQSHDLTASDMETGSVSWAAGDRCTVLVYVKSKASSGTGNVMTHWGSYFRFFGTNY